MKFIRISNSLSGAWLEQACIRIYFPIRGLAFRIYFPYTTSLLWNSKKSIINDNGLTKRNDHLAYSVKKNKNFDREIKNGGCLKTVNFKKFSIYKSGLAALIKKTAIEFKKKYHKL